MHRGVFRSVPQLIDAVMGYIEQHNNDPKPFVWRKTAEEIIEKVGRARLVLNNAPTG
ncbi:MAG: hypothetical protein IID36_03910 [Planctomycetes bacterium]|nr:hypothetical protein [Planctomycetota bacterium]